MLLYLDYDISFSENGVDPDRLASGQDSGSPIFKSVKIFVFVECRQQGSDLHLCYPPILKL